MEKSEPQAGYRDSIENLAFEPTGLETNLLRRGEYVRLPSPQKSVDEEPTRGRRRRPISLKADLDVPKSPVRDTKKSQAKKARQGEKAGESGRRKRPIRLKADLDTAKAPVLDANQTQGETPRQRKKASDSGRRRRPITLKGELDSWDVPSTKETPAKEARQRKEVGEPPSQEKASVEASASPAMPTVDDTPAPSPAPSTMGNATASPFEAWLSWAQMHRRLLLVVGLSFIAGIMFRGWFIGEESPAPSQITKSRPVVPDPVPSQTMDSAPSALRPAPESTRSQRQQVPNSGYSPGVYSQPTPPMGDYPPQEPVYPDPRYDGARPPQYPSARSPNRGWDDYGYQTMPRTPSASPQWQPQTTPGYQNPMQQRRFNPWTYEGQQYP
jgi:hypothetical protein